MKIRDLFLFVVLTLGIASDGYSMGKAALAREFSGKYKGFLTGTVILNTEFMSMPMSTPFVYPKAALTVKAEKKRKQKETITKDNGALTEILGSVRESVLLTQVLKKAKFSGSGRKVSLRGKWTIDFRDSATTMDTTQGIGTFTGSIRKVGRKYKMRLRFLGKRQFENPPTDFNTYDLRYKGTMRAKR